MGCGNSICGKRGIALISEARQRLQLSKLIETRFLKLFVHIAEL